MAYVEDEIVDHTRDIQEPLASPGDARVDVIVGISTQLGEGAPTLNNQQIERPDHKAASTKMFATSLRVRALLPFSACIPGDRGPHNIGAEYTPCYLGVFSAPYQEAI